MPLGPFPDSVDSIHNAFLGGEQDNSSRTRRNGINMAPRLLGAGKKNEPGEKAAREKLPKRNQSGVGMGTGAAEAAPPRALFDRWEGRIEEKVRPGPRLQAGAAIVGPGTGGPRPPVLAPQHGGILGPALRAQAPSLRNNPCDENRANCLHAS